MPNETPVYDLVKPLQTEDYDVDVFNGNADKIEAALVALASALNNPTPTITNLSDVANPPLNSALGKLFRLTATGNRVIPVPTNPVDGRSIIIAHRASGAARTLGLTTGVAGGFKFGTDFTALTATTQNTTDYIGCIFHASDNRWHVISYVKGL